MKNLELIIPQWQGDEDKVYFIIYEREFTYFRGYCFVDFDVFSQFIEDIKEIEKNRTGEAVLVYEEQESRIGLTISFLRPGGELLVKFHNACLEYVDGVDELLDKELKDYFIIESTLVGVFLERLKSLKPTRI